MKNSILTFLFLSPVFSPAQAAVLPDQVPFASGQVTQMVSANQDGRSKTYRALVVRNGSSPEHDISLVIQKVRQLTDAKENVTNKLIAQLIIPASKLPGGVEAHVDSIRWVSNNEEGEFFEFKFGEQNCKFEFDSTGSGSDLKLEFFSCK